MDQKPDSRRAARHPLEASIEVADGVVGGELSFESRDVSRGGLFIKSDLLLEVGETFFVSFTLPGTKVALRTRGRVVWVNRYPKENDPTDRAGMGVKFLDLSEAEQAALDAYLTSD